MNMLGIDTATGRLGVIACADERMINCSANTGYRHGESLMSWIETILAELALDVKKLDLIVCVLGPGSFTGLRIGLATAKGLSLGTGCPLVGVPSLDVFGARFSFFEGTVFPIIDAKKKCFYTAGYEHGQRVTKYLYLSLEELKKLVGEKSRALLTGPDCQHIIQFYTDSDQHGHVSILPSDQELATLLSLGLGIFKQQGPMDPAQGPLYLRKSEAEIIREQKMTDCNVLEDDDRSGTSENIT